MLPFIRIFEMEIPSYTVFAVLGMIFALLVSIFYGRQYGILRIDIVTSFCYGMFGMILGAKLFYAVPFLPEMFALWKEEGTSYLLENGANLLSQLFAGYVFYGGFLGMLGGVFVYAKIRRLPFLCLADILALAVPLFHGFGRIGCFFAGCCYGKKYDGIFSVQFPMNPYHADLDSVERFPVQLAESIGNFALFLFLLVYRKKDKPSGNLLGMYLMLYSVMRFLLEYLRGDLIRGVWQIGMISLSFSQMISFVVFLIGMKILTHQNKCL